MGSLFSKPKTKQVIVHFNGKKQRVVFNSEDYNADNKIPLQKFRTKLAKALNVPATSLKLFTIKPPQKPIDDMSATLESYGIKGGSEIFAVQEADQRATQTVSAHEKIADVMNSLESELGERIRAFVAEPPVDLPLREQEHRILSESVLARLISLDNIEISTPEERSERKEAIAKLHKYHQSVDASLNAADAPKDPQPKPEAPKAEKASEEPKNEVPKFEAPKVTDPETKEPVIEAKETKVEAKVPVVETKEPVVEAKETNIETKEPVVEAKGPVVEAKEPVVETKEPVVEAKETKVETKEPVVETKETKVEAKEPKAEAKETKVEAKEPVEPAAETPKPETKAEPKIETPKPEAKVEPKIETPKPEAKVEPKSEPKIENAETQEDTQTNSIDLNQQQTVAVCPPKHTIEEINASDKPREAKPASDAVINAVEHADPHLKDSKATETQEDPKEASEEPESAKESTEEPEEGAAKPAPSKSAKKNAKRNAKKKKRR